jgi:pimeloyl-ACP methyl ester carboxylesterase
MQVRGFAVQPVTVMHRGQTIRGSRYGKQGNRAVLIAHGFSDSRIGPGRLIVDLARALVAADFCVWAFDRLGHGESDGELFDVNVPDEIDQLATMMEAIHGQVHLIGHSLGGMECATLAGHKPDSIASVTLLAAAAASADDIARHNVLGHPFEELRSHGRFDISGQALGSAFIEGMKGYDPYEGLSRFEGPVFCHHGLCDDVVDPDYSRRYCSTFSQATLTTYPDVGHTFDVLESRRTLICNCVGELIAVCDAGSD